MYGLVRLENENEKKKKEKESRGEEGYRQGGGESEKFEEEKGQNEKRGCKGEGGLGIRQNRARGGMVKGEEGERCWWEGDRGKLFHLDGKGKRVKG